MTAVADGELRALIALVQSAGLGPRRIAKLLSRCGSAEAVLAAGMTLWRELKLPAEAVGALAAPDWGRVEASLRWAEHRRTWILARGDPAYPRALAEIADAPPLLFGVGDVALLREPQLGIVGSRNPTPDGVETTYLFAEALARLGIIITSGLAIGIDTAAHRGALAGGGTIAVMGTGPDQIYPRSNRELALRIMDRGALISEFPPGVGPHGSHFPRRNRIISGLSLGVLVTEAAVRSGSLITARQAAEQGREVFAIPGSIQNPLARGCHALIRDGAKLVDSIDLLLEELRPQLEVFIGAPAARGPAPDGPGQECPGRPLAAPAADPSTEPADDALDADEQRLLACLGYGPITPDELIRRSELPAREVASMLLLLELRGWVSAHPGGRYSRKAIVKDE